MAVNCQVHCLGTFHLLAPTLEELRAVYCCVIGIEDPIARAMSSHCRNHGHAEILSFVVAAELTLSSVIVFVHAMEGRLATDSLTSLAYVIVLHLLRDWGKR